jgi:hypothetical protein
MRRIFGPEKQDKRITVEIKFLDLSTVEDEGAMCLQNTGNWLPFDTGSYPRRIESSVKMNFII